MCAMKQHGQDPMRPSTPPPATSWWADKPVQESREAFDARAKQEAHRQNAVQVAYNKPGTVQHD